MRIGNSSEDHSMDSFSGQTSEAPSGGSTTLVASTTARGRAATSTAAPGTNGASPATEQDPVRDAELSWPPTQTVNGSNGARSAELEHRCSRCKQVWPESEMAAGRQRKDGTISYSWCKACKRDAERLYRQTPLGKAKAKAKQEAYYERLKAADPEALHKKWRKAKARKDEQTLARRRDTSRRYREKRRKDPLWRAAENAKNRERRARLKAEDPEAYAKMREDEKRRYRLRRQDTGRLKRDREARRMREALNRERRGVLGNGTPRRKVAVEQEVGGSLPVLPLVEQVVVPMLWRQLNAEGYNGGDLDAALEDARRDSVKIVDTVADSLGVDVRTVYAWRNGERTSSHVDVIDHALVATDHLWWEVYDVDRYPEAHREAKEKFE